jgi:hypothetical protein
MGCLFLFIDQILYLFLQFGQISFENGINRNLNVKQIFQDFTLHRVIAWSLLYFQ